MFPIEEPLSTSGSGVKTLDAIIIILSDNNRFGRCALYLCSSFMHVPAINSFSLACGVLGSYTYTCDNSHLFQSIFLN